MTTPKDIDGNELRVGDDVELARWGTQGALTSLLYIGDRFKITGFDNKPPFVSAEVDPFLIGCHLLRLIPRDTKAPTKIEFVTTKEGVR